MGKVRPLSRRAFLFGTGATIALPWLDAMATPKTNSPVRMAYLYFPNGSAEGSWSPAQTGNNGALLQLNEWMKPLETFKRDLLIPENLWTPRGNGHMGSTATWLTGGGYDRARIDAGGVSVDQRAARAIGNQTMLPSLQLSLKGEGNFSKEVARNNMSWSASGTPVSREIEPRVVFDRMFLKGGPGATDRSVLDHVREDARSLRNRVGPSDRRKMDEYLEAVRAIERRIQFAENQAKKASGRKQLTAALKRPPAGFPESHEEYMRQMLDLVVLAFWADATRICTFMLDHGQSNRYFNFIPGVKGTWHALSHWKDASGKTEDDDGVTGAWTSKAVKKDQYNAVTRWHHEQLAYFLGRLKSVREGGATLLDQSMILYGSGISDGHEHGEKNLPLIVAGRAGGTLKTGRHLRFRRQTSLSELHLAFLRRMGAKADSFGGSRRELPGLEG